MIRSVVARLGWKDRFPTGLIQVLITMDELCHLLRSDERQRRASAGEPQLHFLVADWAFCKFVVEHDSKGLRVPPPTAQAQRPGPRDAWIATRARWPGSLQRIDTPMKALVGFC